MQFRVRFRCAAVLVTTFTAMVSGCATEVGTVRDGESAGSSGSAGMQNNAAGSSGSPSTGGSLVGPAAGSAGQTSMGGSAGGGGLGGSAGDGGTGGSAGGGSGGTAGSGGSGGATTEGHRYVRFVATSEQGGNPWTAVAEFWLSTEGSQLIDRETWLISADSEELVDESAPASAAIDGNVGTFWHTAYDGEAGDPLPHELIIDLGAAQPITGFSYQPRQDGPNGRIADWEIYLSVDGIAWGTAVDSGTFPAQTTLQKIIF
jgi:large repetitive protein